ncbi:MAG: pyridoxal phosphate-dependent aminotransferase [Verrucomicrobiota bacterium JB024]|nr:pyridoxal phosphate-dependent aminotransferase [Verrucomicrobiota bacterium JB024]
MPGKQPFSSRTQWDLDEINLTEDDSPEYLYDLTVSNPTACGFDYGGLDLPALFGGCDLLRYEPEPFGLRAAREAVASHVGDEAIPSADNIMLTASTSDAYHYLFRMLCDPGDEILAPAPSYPLFGLLAEVNDCRLVPYPLVHDGGLWRIDQDALLRAVGPKTRAILIVNPNNPTGSYLREDDLAFLDALAQRHNLSLICDEVFSDYPHLPGADAVRSVVGRTGALTFILGGLSKSLALPQLKLAWTLMQCADARLLRQARRRLEVIADIFLSVATPVQQVLPALLERQAAIQPQIRQRIATNLSYLEKQLADARLPLPTRVEGGWYAVVPLPPDIRETRLTETLAEDTRTRIHPGYFYDFSSPHAVLSLLTPPDVWRAGLEHFVRAVRKVSAAELS